MSKRNIRVLVGGPNSSGKSTFTISLYRHLKLYHPHITVGLHELDVHSDTHAPLLGLKPWSERNKRWPLPQEAPHEVVEERVAEFLGDESQLVFGDLPGRIANPYMSSFIAAGTHAIYVGHTLEAYPDWRKAFLRSGIEVIELVHTALNGQNVPQESPYGNFIVMRDLERQTNPDFPGLETVAKKLLALLA